MSLEASGNYRHLPYQPSQEIEEVEEHFSFVTAFASGAYTLSPESDTTDKVRVIGMWIFSIVFPLFPLVTFFVCWIKDLVDLFEVPNTPEFQLPPLSEQEATEEAIEEILESDVESVSLSENSSSNSTPNSFEMVPRSISPSIFIPIKEEEVELPYLAKTPSPLTLPPPAVETRPRLKSCSNILSGVRENHCQAVHNMIKTMATGNGQAIQALNKKPIIDYLNGISPIQTLAIILSDNTSIEHLATLKTRKNVWIFLSVNPYTEFCAGWAGIDVKRKAMGEEKWQQDIAKFEAYCNVEPGTYAKLTTQEFINKVVEDRVALHNVVLRRIAQSTKHSS